MQPISSYTIAPLPSGAFAVLDAWDESQSGYSVNIEAGKIVSFETSDPEQVCHVEDANKYIARGFSLLGALAASVSCPNAGEGNEEQFMLAGI